MDAITLYNHVMLSLLTMSVQWTLSLHTITCCYHYLQSATSERYDIGNHVLLCVMTNKNLRPAVAISLYNHVLLSLSPTCVQWTPSLCTVMCCYLLSLITTCVQQTLSLCTIVKFYHYFQPASSGRYYFVQSCVVIFHH